MIRSALTVTLLLISGLGQAAYIDWNSYDGRTSERVRTNLASFTLNGSPFRGYLTSAPVSIPGFRLQLPWYRNTLAQRSAMEKLEVVGEAAGERISLYRHSGEIPGSSAYLPLTLNLPANACGKQLQLRVQAVARYRSRTTGTDSRFLITDLARNTSLKVDCAPPSWVRGSLENDWSNAFDSYFSSGDRRYNPRQLQIIPGEERCILSPQPILVVRAHDDLGIKRLEAETSGVSPSRISVEGQDSFRRAISTGPATRSRLTARLRATDGANNSIGSSLELQMAARRPEQALTLRSLSPSNMKSTQAGKPVSFSGVLASNDCGLLMLAGGGANPTVLWSIVDQAGRALKSGSIRLRGRSTPFLVTANAVRGGTYRLQLKAPNGGSPLALNYPPLTASGYQVQTQLSPAAAKAARESVGSRPPAGIQPRFTLPGR